MSNGFTDEELDYLAKEIVNTFFARIRTYIEQMEVALDAEKHRQDEGAEGV